ncbi:MAG TPA: diiron oxygenase [Pseudonocardiaceae bacterium]
MKLVERETLAGRLLISSAKASFDPAVEVDWDAPAGGPGGTGSAGLSLHRSSLYGTHLWASMGEQQRIELTRHEASSIASVGVWFELILISMLTRHVYEQDPQSQHAQYALTEIADECRHSTMFGKAIAHLGLPAYGPRRRLHKMGGLLPVIGYGPALYGSVLIVEEILDRLQREAMADESVQPMIRMINRIHVLEEARHVTFARQEVVSGMGTLSRVELAYQQWLVAMVGFQVTHTLINPQVYAAVGLDPDSTWRIAMRNPHYRATIRWAGGRIMAFLGEAGLVGPPGMRFWRRSHLLPA